MQATSKRLPVSRIERNIRLKQRLASRIKELGGVPLDPFPDIPNQNCTVNLSCACGQGISASISKLIRHPNPKKLQCPGCKISERKKTLGVVSYEESRAALAQRILDRIEGLGGTAPDSFPEPLRYTCKLNLQCACGGVATPTVHNLLKRKDIRRIQCHSCVYKNRSLDAKAIRQTTAPVSRS